MPLHNIDQIVKIALDEDIGPGDITTEYLVDPDHMGNATIVAKESLVIAGLEVADEVFRSLDANVTFESAYQDGDDVESGAPVIQVSGTLKALLMGERTALNFLQRLSGIATHVRSYVQMISDHPVRLVDTRKTTPGLRALEKYAVRVGGAFNHRMGLYDGVLIKDNHIAACGGIEQAVSRIRENVSHLVKIEVEAMDLSEVKAALAARADVIMLDNMDIPQIREAVSLIGGNALVEISGGVTKKNLALLAETGVDLISVGALTHSARSVDLSMKITAS
jgi:nicotinate-nucleotide pyrophosphorylase (carboxylating)